MDHWVKNLKTQLRNVLIYLPLFKILNKELNLVIILTEVCTFAYNIHMIPGRVPGMHTVIVTKVGKIYMELSMAFIVHGYSFA